MKNFNRNSNILIQENVFENISTPNSVLSTRISYWLVILVNIVAQSYLQSHQSPSQTGLPLVIGQWWFPMWHLEQTTHHNKIMQILHPASLDVNLLVPEKCVISCCTRAFSNSFYELISWALSVKLVLDECHRTPLKSTQVQVMVWWLTAPSHYLSRCCPSSMSPYGITNNKLI